MLLYILVSLRQIKSIQRSVSQPVLLSLVSSLVLSRLDYGRTVLTGISRRLLDRLQSVLNAAARLIYSRRKYDRVLLRCLRNFTGCESLNESSFDWPFLCLSAAPRQHLSTWQKICSGQQMTAREPDCGQLHPTNWSCAGRDCQQLEIALSASRHLSDNTIILQETFKN